MGGRSTIVHPVEAVGNRIYYMAGLWNKMNKKEAVGANSAALACKQWIEDHTVAETRGNEMRALRGGASCCQHTGFPQHLVDGVKEGRALMSGILKLENRMVKSIMVGALGTHHPGCKVCQKWIQYKGRISEKTDRFMS